MSDRWLYLSQTVSTATVTPQHPDLRVGLHCFHTYISGYQRLLELSFWVAPKLCRDRLKVDIAAHIKGHGKFNESRDGGGGGPMAKNGEKWRKMAKNGDGEFGFFICQIRHFSPIFDFGISHLTHFQTANHLETLQSHYWHQYRTNATHIE